MGLVSRWTGPFCMTAAVALIVCAPVRAQESGNALQCVPYARAVSDIRITGDAWTWWDKAAGAYDRGSLPRIGAVMVMAPAGVMTLGHVAVVSRVLNDREIWIRHANWSVPGAIEEDVSVIDVSDQNDWSLVRVWHGPSARMGARTNPVYGFIYGPSRKLFRFDPARDVPGGARYVVLKQAKDGAPARGGGGGEPVFARLAYRPVDLPAELSVPAGGRRLLVDARASVGNGEMRRATERNATRERSLADIIADVKKSARIG